MANRVEGRERMTRMVGGPGSDGGHVAVMGIVRDEVTPGVTVARQQQGADTDPVGGPTGITPGGLGQTKEPS